MVSIPLPPPARPTNPSFITVTQGSRLFRIYSDDRHHQRPLSFRYVGPWYRFDHQLPPYVNTDPPGQYGVLYAAPSLRCCVVEVFEAAITLQEKRVVTFSPVEDLLVLDLVDNAAMQAGTVVAISMNADHPLSQAWARHFYDTMPQIKGIRYRGAHNGDEAMVFFERCDDPALFTVLHDRPWADALDQLLVICGQTGLHVELGDL